MSAELYRERDRSSRLAVVVCLLACAAAGCGDVPTRSLGPDWMRKAKLAGLAVYPGMSADLLEQRLDDLVDQHVDVVIGDSELSNYLTDAQFATHVALINRVARETHRRGMKLIWYIPSLEVQTVDGVNKQSTMGKDHPDWLQVGVGGKRNVFYGTQEDWVEATDESAWMCPISGYRDYFLARIKRLAASSLDGVWVDVPVYLDTGVKWNCSCDRHKAKFKQDTGLTLPTAQDCTDEDQPAGACAKLWSGLPWRRWIQYRHHELNDFQLAIHQAARQVKPDFETVIEVFTMDYNDAMDKGLDGTFMGNVPGLTHVWEVDSVSNGQGMLRAGPDDWIAKVGLFKFARGADKQRPTWVFSYGNQEWDAELVMAAAFAAQTNPYETKTPQMATTVGGAFRKRMYSWADRHQDALYGSKSAARVALLYSSLSRDYVDYPYGFALYNDTAPPSISGVDPTTKRAYSGPDKEWWSNETRDSARGLEFLGEFRGFIKALSHLHVPFAVEAMQQLTAADLQGYETLIAPNLTAVTDQQAKLLREFVKGGGNLIITGTLPTGLDGHGTPRKSLALADLLGFDLASLPAVDARRQRVHGVGRVHHENALLARRYLRTGDAGALRRVGAMLAATTSSPLTTDALSAVHLELYRLDASGGRPGELVLHLLNFSGINGNGVPPEAPQDVEVTLQLPPGTRATSAVLSSPERGHADRALPLLHPAAGLARLTARVNRYALARIKLASASSWGALNLQVRWPTRGVLAPALSATARISGAGLTGVQVQQLKWGEGSGQLSFAALPEGDKLVELVTADSGAAVAGRLLRRVTLKAGETTRLRLDPGIAADHGPAAVEARVGDLIFVANGSATDATASAGSLSRTLKPGQWASIPITSVGKMPFSAGSVTGHVQVSSDGAGPGAAPRVTSLSATRGHAGHGVVILGAGLGSAPGELTWGGQACVVTEWTATRVAGYLPSAAKPGTAALALRVHGRQAAAGDFTVVAPSISLTAPMKLGYDFIKQKMSSASGGVYTNHKDRVDPSDIDLVYPFGHHQTAEHMGLLLWTSAALVDHATFERSYQFLVHKMVSPRQDVVNWAIHKKTGKPMLSRDDKTAPWLNANAPLDDFRVIKGLVAGWMQWHDQRYRDLALRIGNGLFTTCVSSREDFPKYPNGLVAYAYNWPELAGQGRTDVQVIPIDYADLWTMRWLAQRDPRWASVLAESIKLMEGAQIQTKAQAGAAVGSFYPGQFFNSLVQETQKLSGDFEYRDIIAGQKVKSIQSLWIAIHLARVGRTAAASRALAFYKDYYARHKRIDEYINYAGTPCLESFFDNTLRNGEVRIYAQAARLAYYLGDRTFGDKLVRDKILPDQNLNAGAATLGNIGMSTSEQGDAEAWNTLESLVTLAQQRGSKVVSHVYAP